MAKKKKERNQAADEAAKQAGYKSLSELADLEKRSRATLWRWFNEKPHLFEAALERHKK